MTSFTYPYLVLAAIWIVVMGAVILGPDFFRKRKKAQSRGYIDRFLSNQKPKISVFSHYKGRPVYEARLDGIRVAYGFTEITAWFGVVYPETLYISDPDEWSSIVTAWKSYAGRTLRNAMQDIDLYTRTR